MADLSSRFFVMRAGANVASPFYIKVPTGNPGETVKVISEEKEVNGKLVKEFRIPDIPENRERMFREYPQEKFQYVFMNGEKEVVVSHVKQMKKHDPRRNRKSG